MSTETNLGKWVEVEFDCLPLRAVERGAAPEDASPKLAAKIQRIQDAIDKHGTLNSYYLHNAKCVYHLTNDPEQGMLEYTVEGVVLTDQGDMQSRSCDLQISLERETCPWLNQAVVDWLGETVQRSLLVEFNRYIAAGDLSKTLDRLQKLQDETEAGGGFVGMYL